MSTVPNSACAMPTPQRMKYFHAASIDSGVRYSETSSTVVSVASFHRHPQNAEIVGRQREQHREQEALVHRVVQAQTPFGDAPALDLVAHVGA